MYSKSPLSLGDSSLVMVLGTVMLCVLGATAQTAKPTHPPATSPTTPDLGVLHDDLYRNPTFDFSYKIPFGWVERTDQMRESATDQPKSFLLLSAFERPPQAVGDTVNSAVVIAAESVSSYPGLKTADDYFDPLTEAAESKGFKAVGDLYDFQIGAKKLVRGDFSKAFGKLTMYQASLVTIEKGYIVSFTFIAGSEDELEALIMDLHFGPAAKPGSKSSPS